MSSGIWDAVVIGSGPAGLTAGMYLARAGHKVILLERGMLGGQARRIDRIENYPGFPSGISGKILMTRLTRQGFAWGLGILHEEVLKAERAEGAFFRLETHEKMWRTRSFLLCTGSIFRPAGIEGEERLRGKGVYNAAFENSIRFKNKEVAVVGSGETAAHQAIQLARYARRVHVLCRGSGLKSIGLLQRRLRSLKNVRLAFDTDVPRLSGSETLESLTVRDVRSGKRSLLRADGVFVLVGKEPDWSLLKGLKEDRTGIFIAGEANPDCEHQVACASADGMRAAMQCSRFLRNENN